MYSVIVSSVVINTFVRQVSFVYRLYNEQWKTDPSRNLILLHTTHMLSIYYAYWTINRLLLFEWVEKFSQWKGYFIVHDIAD